MSSEKDQKQQLPSENYIASPHQTEAEAAEQKGFYPQVDVTGSSPEAHGAADVTGSNPEAHGAADVTGSSPHGAADSEKEKAKWGTRIMGAPSAPSAHPQNQEAAMWNTPYVLNKDDAPQHNSRSPMEMVLERFNTWTKKAEDLASNVWTNLKTGTSVPDAAWGKLSLGAKALTEGGFEALFKQTFSVDPNEKLRKTFACYLSTSTGPVAGTLYISTVKIAFCSDRPLSFKVPSGEEGWSYYRVAIPLANAKSVKPSVNKENPAQKYIQVVTVDYHEFWFMGFVNYDKALSALEESVAVFHSSAKPATV